MCPGLVKRASAETIDRRITVRCLVVSGREFAGMADTITQTAGSASPVDVGESRFEDITDWLPRAAVELNQSQVFDRPKVPRSSADFDPR
jgi:hypothetical protein